MSAEKFIDHVAATGSVDEAILEKLRQKVAKSEKAVSIEKIVKVLMDQGHLTRFLATKLVSEYSQNLKSDAKSEAKTDPSLQTPQASSRPASGEDLGFAPDESLDGTIPAKEINPSTPDPEDDIVDLEDASASPSSPQVASSPQANANWQGAERVSASPDPLAAAGGLATDPLADPLANAMDADPLAGDFGDYQESSNEPTTPSRSGGLQLPQPERSQWDTKLIIGGSLALGILAIAAFGLFFVLRSGSASEVFEMAEKDYNTGAYQNAIEKYEVFIKKYPKHDNASLAFVRTKMAGLRQNVGRPTEALTYALKELPELKVQPAFSEARGELATVLPSIAESFADQAAKARETEKKDELIANAEKSMDELVNQAAYIPTKLRSNPDVASRIKRIQEKIKNVRRNIDRENNLVAAVEKITEFTNKGETADAFVARRTLLEKYPGLETDERLVKAVLNISKKEAELVTVQSDTKDVTSDEVASPDFQVKVALKPSTGSKSIPGVAGHVCCVLVGGAVYGIDVTSGEGKWRRFVGAETTTTPQPVSDQPGADVLLVDSANHDLLRVKSQTGELVWRLPVGSPFLDPVHYKDLLLINTRDGRLLEVNKKTGANTRIVGFPMELGTVAAYGDEQPLLYQVGEHHNLYVVDSETMECQEVLYLGHKKGSVDVSPVYAVGFLLLVENIASDRSVLHVIAMNEKGRDLKEIQRIALQGKVVVPPLVFERRVLITTDLGAVHVYDVDPNIDPPVQTLAEIKASATKAFVSYPIVYRGQVWVAGKTLSKYRVQPALSQLNRVWIQDDGDTFVAPLSRVEDVLIHARRRRGEDAVTISGQPLEAELPSWQTDIGAPAKVSLDRRNNRLRAVSAQGGYFPITAETTKGMFLEQPATATEESQDLAFNRLVEFSGGRLAVTGPGQQHQVLVIDSAAEPVPPRLVSLKPFGTKVADAIGFQDRLLVPFEEGMIRLFDLKDGSQSVMPFQPELRAGDRKAWSTPVVDRADPNKFVVLENGRQLYRVGIKESPQRHMAALQQRTLAEPITNSIAALGDTLFAVKREADHDVVVTFQLPGFEDDHQWPLQGRVVWGPRRVNARVFVATDQQGLLCFDSQWNWWKTPAVLRWQAALPYGNLAGLPFKEKNSYVLASTEGTVWRVDRETGYELEKIEPLHLKRPLSGNPVVYDGQLWLSGIDGVLFVVPFPPAT